MRFVCTICGAYLEVDGIEQMGYDFSVKIQPCTCQGDLSNVKEDLSRVKERLTDVQECIKEALDLCHD